MLIKSSSPVYTYLLFGVAIFTAYASVSYGSIEMLYAAGVIGGVAYLHWHYSALRRKHEREDETAAPASKEKRDG